MQSLHKSDLAGSWSISKGFLYILKLGTSSADRWDLKIFSHEFDFRMKISFKLFSLTKPKFNYLKHVKSSLLWNTFFSDLKLVGNLIFIIFWVFSTARDDNHCQYLFLTIYSIAYQWERLENTFYCLLLLWSFIVLDRWLSEIFLATYY